jgi:hypothetical protein
MKKLIFIVLFGLLSVSGWGQNYVRLDDASGFNPGSYIDSLELAATDLKNTFSNDLKEAFKVFDAGFYLYNSEVSGSNELDSVWIRIKENITSEHPLISYYILFGRVMYPSGKLEIKVEVVLPETDIFYCIDNISPGFRKEIENQVSSKANSLLNPQSIFNNEVNAIKQLKYIIQKKICCDPEGSGFRFVSCDACMLDTSDFHYDFDGKKIYPAFKEYERLDQLDFVIEAVKIVNDDEYFIPSDNTSFKGYDNQGTRNAAPINGTIQFRDNVIASVDNLKDSIIAATTSFSIYTYKYPRDCGSFEKKWNDYINDSGPALFIALINVDRQNGIIAYHFDCCGSSLKTQGRTRSPGAGNPTPEDLEGMREALASSGSTCYKTILAYGEKFEYNVSKLMGDIVGSAEQKKSWANEYKARKERVSSNLNSAQKEYGFYFDLEFKIQKRKYNRWDWTASAISHYNMCAEVVHGVLDMCGVIEPVGLICDGTNAVIYALRGDKVNATIASLAVIPGISQAKIITKIAKTTPGSPAGVVYRAVLKPGTNYLHWVGGSSKLSRVMAKVGGTPSFCRITDNLNFSSREIHHLIPYSFTDYTNLNKYKDALCKKLDAAGWHPSLPTLNGFNLPKYFRDGATFHGSHDNYINWVENALKQIDDEGIEGQTLYNKMNELSIYLREEIVKAYGNGKSKASGGTGKSLHDHFKNIPKYTLKT